MRAILLVCTALVSAIAPRFTGGPAHGSRRVRLFPHDRHATRARLAPQRIFAVPQPVARSLGRQWLTVFPRPRIAQCRCHLRKRVAHALAAKKLRLLRRQLVLSGQKEAAVRTDAALRKIERRIVVAPVAKPFTFIF